MPRVLHLFTKDVVRYFQQGNDGYRDYELKSYRIAAQERASYELRKLEYETKCAIGGVIIEHLRKLCKEDKSLEPPLGEKKQLCSLQYIYHTDPAKYCAQARIDMLQQGYDNYKCTICGDNPEPEQSIAFNEIVISKWGPMSRPIDFRDVVVTDIYPVNV